MLVHVLVDEAAGLEDGVRERLEGAHVLRSHEVYVTLGHKQGRLHRVVDGLHELRRLVVGRLVLHKLLDLVNDLPEVSLFVTEFD